MLRPMNSIAVCLFLALGLASGCQTTSLQQANEANTAAIGIAMAPMKQWAPLYLSPERYSKIYVKVDAIKGSELDDKTLTELRDFLQSCTNKPVTIQRDDPISFWATRLLSPKTVAIRNMQGPPQNVDSDDVAYLYILLCPGLNVFSSRWGFVRPDYPTGIIVSQSNVRVFGDQMFQWILRHELGHCLGLCTDTTHGDGMHCADKSCLMFKGISISRSSAGNTPTDFCDKCKETLRLTAQQEPSAKLEFNGPFLIRKEDGYSVAMLPSYFVLDFRPPELFDCQAELRRARKIMARNSKGWRCFAAPDFSSRSECLRASRAIEAALGDSDKRVAEAARKLKASLEKKFGAFVVTE